MIKSDLLISKLDGSFIIAPSLSLEEAKYRARAYIRDQVETESNYKTKEIYYSKTVSGVSGVNVLNLQFNYSRTIFGIINKVIRPKKRKKNCGIEFLYWSNYFSFLLSKMKYWVVISAQSPHLLQGAFKKHRFNGISYIYLSDSIVRGLDTCIGFFGGMDNGTFLFYAAGVSKFMELLSFLYSDSFYRDFILVSCKIDNYIYNDVRSIFFYKSIGFNKFNMINMLRGYVPEVSKLLGSVLSMLYTKVAVHVLQLFVPYRIINLKYVNLYTGRSRLS